MLWRPFSPQPSRASLASLLGAAMVGAVVVTVAACGNISLSNGTSLSPAVSGVELPHADASADGGTSLLPIDGAGGATGPAPTSDAASTSVGNPLCFLDYGTSGVHKCLPDEQPTSNQCPDGGVATPSPASDAQAQRACHVVKDGQSCLADGPGGDGAQCQTSTDCAPSFECVGSPGQCRHYCCGGNATCDDPSTVTVGATFCDVQATVSGGLNVPVCEPVNRCTLLLTGSGAGTCPKGETCAVVKDDGTTSCVPIGTVGIGSNCDVFHCAAQLTCLGAVGTRACFQLCQVDSPSACPYGTTCTSSAQLFTNANVGICQ